MLTKHAIFCLEFFSLILLSTTSLANHNNYNYSSNKNRTSYIFNRYNNLLHNFVHTDLVEEYIGCGKETIVPDSSVSSLLETKKNQEKSSSWLSTMCSAIWGRPFSNRFYGGMWTRHLEQRAHHVTNNKLIAFCYHGIYLGTFINSYGDRTYSVGVQRLLYNHNFSKAKIEIGYRMGGLYGYSEYLRLFDTKFFFPMFQVIADVSLGNIITQVSWAWIVFNVCFGYRF